MLDRGSSSTVASQGDTIQVRSVFEWAEQRCGGRSAFGSAVSQLSSIIDSRLPIRCARSLPRHVVEGGVGSVISVI
jgi:hypothetical protein